MSGSRDQAAPDQRWVCAACGAYSEPGARRGSFRDVACVLAAVLCEADRDPEGRWRGVDPIELHSSNCRSWATKAVGLLVAAGDVIHAKKTT